MVFLVLLYIDDKKFDHLFELLDLSLGRLTSLTRFAMSAKSGNFFLPPPHQILDPLLGQAEYFSFN